MDFDTDIFLKWIIDVKPEYVWLGLNSRNKQIQIPEPSETKLREFISELKKAGIKIQFKELRGLEV